ncbi:MAG: tetratricopeptide repeat protein [Chlorobi bacterium]|nr:tetratricopeptide repeat protein [Chlorobiota bacterium]
MKHFIALIITMLILINTVPATANEADKKFVEAGKNYQAAEFQIAAELYEEIADNGYKTAEIYYNLGNAYFKLKRNSEAILNYERALKISPDDEDIIFNLNIANLKIVDKFEVVPEFFVWEYIGHIRSLMSGNGWSFFAVLMIWLSAGSFALYYFMSSTGVKKIFLMVSFLALVSAASGFVFAGQQTGEELSNNTGIIFSTNVYVKNSPDDSGTDLFILHEGTKVELIDEVGEWRRIKLPNGSKGWLQGNTIEII